MHISKRKSPAIPPPGEVLVSSLPLTQLWKFVQFSWVCVCMYVSNYSLSFYSGKNCLFLIH